ncbi:MAG: glycosyltransferase family A protein [Bacteroidota bacterium]|nr:glycosyltransferase family A protein [Bacteroidota bacterium]
MNKAVISVIIPVFNGGRFLSEAIDSVLAQNYDALEIIIIDDGSTDNSKEVALGYGNKIKYLYQENGGPAKARNFGLSIATGDFITFIDADDVWAKDKISRQLALFGKNEELGIVIGLAWKTGFSVKEELDKPGLTPKGTFHLLLGSSLIKKSVFDRIGLLDEDLFLGDDTDWFNRAKENRIAIAIHRDVVQYYRIHENNITNDKRRSNHYVFKVIKKAKDRKMSPDFKPLPAAPKIKTMDDLINYWHSAN